MGYDCQGIIYESADRIRVADRAAAAAYEIAAVAERAEVADV